MTRRASSQTQHVRAVERAIDILQCFSADKPAMSVVEIEKKIRLNRPTLYRLLQTLAARGLVRAHGTPQRFSLDAGVAQLAQNWLSGLEPMAAGRPILERLHRETAESVGLAVLRDTSLLFVAELRSTQPLGMVRGVGATSQLARGASGKAALAFLDDATRETFIEGLPTDAERNRLRRELAEVRRDKFKLARGEIFPGFVSVAAPYFDYHHDVAGVISVYGPETRLGKNQLARVTKLVVAAATELSGILGHAPSREARR